jgi:hypothetical protein
MALLKKPSNLHIQRRRLWGLRMAKMSYKEQAIKTETMMVIVLRRLLRAHGNCANKSFFCMYLIRPSVSSAIAAFPPPIVQFESRFEAHLNSSAY